MGEEKSSNRNIFSSVDMVAFLWKWRKPIITVTLLGAIVSIVASLLIEEKYRSSVILYPAESSSISRTLINAEKDVSWFGEEEETEQLLQILQSNALRERIIKKHDLLTHYGLSRDNPKHRIQLYRTFKNNTTFERTEYGSVRIAVLDQDPDTAAMLANDIAALVDTIKNRMQQRRAKKGLDIVEREYRAVQNKIRRIEDSLSWIRKQGVNDYRSQSEVWNEQLAVAIVENDQRAVRTLEQKLDTVSMYGSAYLSLHKELDKAHDRLGQLYDRYQEAKVDANQTLPHKFVVDKAMPSEKKAYPIRWLIVSASTASAFFLSIFLILALEQFRFLKKRIQGNA